MMEMIEATAQMRDALAKSTDAHKYHYGHAVVLSGGVGKGGAARLAARAALRVGAGLVTVLAPQVAIAEHAAQLTAVMLRTLPDAYSLRGILTQDARINALLLGPGLGLARAREMVPAALWSKRACVLDADALSAFADDPDTLMGALHPNVVLTPHGGEFARLFPDLASQMHADTVAPPAAPVSPPLSAAITASVTAAVAAAQRAGCTVLLKGAETVVAAPDGRARVHRATGAMAAPWLATAGSGDVLAGIITGLLARGFPPDEAAATGCWLHAAAARAFGPGLIAEDLPDELPRVFRDLSV